MIKDYIKNSLNKQFPLKTIQRYGRQFRCNSKCSEKNNVFFRCCSRFDAYLIYDWPISKDAVKFVLSLYRFGFGKRTSCGEKCKIRIGENQLRFPVEFKKLTKV